MLIKDTDNENTFLIRLIKGLYNKKVIFILISVILYAGVFFYLGIYFESKVFPEIRQKQELHAEQKKIAEEKIRKVVSASPDHIEIVISDGDYEEIVDKRNEGVKGILATSSKDYVRGQIRYKDKTYRIKIRLKGDWWHHLLGDQWSYRVSVKGGDTLFGMREFSLQHPKQRNYIHEWIFHNALRRENLMSLRYGFVDVTFNGNYLGTYAIEEHFDKLLIENNGHREGPIIKFDEDLLWADRRRGFGNEINYIHSSAIDVFQEKKVRANTSLREQYIIAFNLLERLRSGELNPSEVFNIEKMARYYALSDLLNAQHGINAHNLRFYFNPITSKLEPIGFDADAGIYPGYLTIRLANNVYSTDYRFHQILFSNSDFMNAYLAELNRFSKTSYLEELFSDIGDELSKNLTILSKNHPEFSFSTKPYKDSQRRMRNVLNPFKAVHAYFENFDGNYLTLRIGNTQEFPVRLNGIVKNNTTIFSPVDENIVEGKYSKEPIKYKKIRLKPNGSINWSDDLISKLGIEINVVNSDFKSVVKIYDLPKYMDNFLAKDLIRQDPNIDQIDFLHVEQKENRITVKPGKWRLNSDLIIPAGYFVAAGPGTEIDLVDKAKVLSYSPLSFEGSKANPVTVYSSDGSGQGIAILNAKDRSVLRHVIFKNLSAPKKGGWELTGAVTFYQSPASISNCEFVDNNLGDDFLNIVRSDFDLRDSYFGQTTADAVDIDFSNGTMSNLTFEHSGNDAMDFSGSKVRIENIYIDQALDKGISVGEDSYIRAKDVEIKNSNIALASKDSSKLEIENLKLEDCSIGFTAFQKKPEFGPAEIIGNSVSKENVDRPYLVQKGSRLVINGTVIQSNLFL